MTLGVELEGWVSKKRFMVFLTTVEKTWVREEEACKNLRLDNPELMDETEKKIKVGIRT